MFHNACHLTLLEKGLRENSANLEGGVFDTDDLGLLATCLETLSEIEKSSIMGCSREETILASNDIIIYGNVDILLTDFWDHKEFKINNEVQSSKVYISAVSGTDNS